MPDPLPVLHALGTAVVLAPAALVAVVGGASLVGRPLSERAAGRAVFLANAVGFLAAVGVLGLMLVHDTRHVVVQLGNWVHIEGADGAANVVSHDDVPHYHFAIKFVFDRLSAPFAVLTFVLCGTIGAFANRYMHRESGYNRFFALYAVFLFGMVTAALAGTIETLFLGWELVGLSSALLVGFFHERVAPVRNALRVWAVYRVSDAALLLAAVALHHMSGEGDLDRLTGYHELATAAPDAPSWPLGRCPLTPAEVLVVGGLLLVAAAGKSALVPFSGWLPRAMEGPTPSSAVFYGALSVHLGAYLLLRAGPLLDASPALSAAVCGLGLVTAAYAAVVGRVQTDIKSALSYASLTQVGLIVAEIGVGWRYLPLAHLIGHACLRTLQFVRAPSVIRDHHGVENALGGRRPRPNGPLARLSPGRGNAWAYRFALERGYLDAALDRFVAGPFVRLFRRLDAWDRRASAAVAGQARRPDPTVNTAPKEVEQRA